MSMTIPTGKKSGLLTGPSPKRGLLTNGQAQPPNPDLDFLSSPEAPPIVRLISPQGEEIEVKKEEAAALVMQGWKLVKQNDADQPPSGEEPANG